MENIMNNELINIATEVILPAEAENYKWLGAENDCDFHGVMNGYVCGFCVQVEKDGDIGYCSCTFTNNFDRIILPNLYADTDVQPNSLGFSIDGAVMRGYIPTGKIVFRGYYTPGWDEEEREDCFFDASDEVTALWNKYVVGVAD